MDELSVVFAPIICALITANVAIISYMIYEKIYDNSDIIELSEADQMSI